MCKCIVQYENQDPTFFAVCKSCDTIPWGCWRAYQKLNLLGARIVHRTKQEYGRLGLNLGQVLTVTTIHSLIHSQVTIYSPGNLHKHVSTQRGQIFMFGLIWRWHDSNDLLSCTSGTFDSSFLNQNQTRGKAFSA